MNFEYECLQIEFIFFIIINSSINLNSIFLLHTHLFKSCHTICITGKALAQTYCKRRHKPIYTDMPPSKPLQFATNRIFPFYFPKKDIDAQKHPEARQQQKRRRMQWVCVMQISLSRNSYKNSVINSKLLITGIFCLSKLILNTYWMLIALFSIQL